MTVQIRTTGAIIQVDWLYKNLYVEHSTNRIFYECELDFDYLKKPMQNHVIEVLVVGQGDLKGVTKELLAEKIFDDRRFKVLSVQIDEE